MIVKIYYIFHPLSIINSTSLKRKPNEIHLEFTLRHRRFSVYPTIEEIWLLHPKAIRFKVSMELPKIVNQLFLRPLVLSQKVLPYTEIDFFPQGTFSGDFFGRWPSLHVLVFASTNFIKLWKLFMIDHSIQK